MRVCIGGARRALIDACCRALETEKAFQLLVQMRQQLGQEPSPSTYAALLESCARAGNVEQARWPHPSSPHHAVGRTPARHTTQLAAAPLATPSTAPPPLMNTVTTGSFNHRQPRWLTLSVGL